jgi:hypothetical protein
MNGDRTIALAEQFDVHPNQVTSWKAQLEGGTADVFGPGSSGGAAEPAVDVKSLHAKIGELTAGGKFLAGGGKVEVVEGAAPKCVVISNGKAWTTPKNYTLRRP